MTDFSEINRRKVFNDTTWIYYCLLCGDGIGNFTPLVMADQKELCLHEQASTTEVGGVEGYCHQASTCICLSDHCALPPAEGTPFCAICGKKFGNGGENRAEGSQLYGNTFEKDKFFGQFWIYYCFCVGASVHAPNATGQFVAASFKEFCCGGAQVLEAPVTNGVCCSSVGTFLCCWDECQLPPHAGNPKVACCGKKLNSDHSAASDVAPGPPKQMDMSQVGN